MATIVRVPALGNDDAVVIARWLAQVGDEVTAGGALVTVETAKSSIDVEAPAGGVLLQTHGDEGDEMPVHAVLAAIGTAGESIDDAVPPGQSSVDTGQRKASTANDNDATEPSIPAMSARAGSEPAREAAADVVPAQPETVPTPPSQVPSGSIPVSPRARLLAARYGVDVTAIRGTGPRGVVVAADVSAHRRFDPTTAAPPGRGRPTAPTAMPGATTTPLTRIRRITAERMTASLSEAAQLTLHRRVPAAALLALRSRLREAPLPRLPRITINHLLLFAISRTLPECPALNAHFAWEGITTYAGVDLGFAVDTARGLLVPTIRGADTMPLAKLAAAAHALASDAAEGRLSPDLLDGATFTVSNLGGLGVDYFTPVLNLPQVAILGVGAPQDRLTGPLLPLSLTFDHRAVDGAAAARLLAALSVSIEHIDALLAT